MRQFLSQLLALAAPSVPAAGAQAHAFLNQAVPPVGGAVPTSPKEIRLTFSEGIEPRFSGIEIATGDGQAVATGPAVPDPGDDKCSSSPYLSWLPVNTVSDGTSSRSIRIALKAITP